MRMTINLDDDLLSRLRDEAHREGVPFRAMLHRIILRGLNVSSAVDQRYLPPSFSMGELKEGIDLVNAIQLGSDFEDEEIAKKFARDA